MLKNDLRENGYSQFEKYQNHTIMTLMWVIITAALVFATFFAVTTIGEFSSNSKFFILLENIGDNLYPWTFSIYIICWIGIFISLGFIVKFKRENKNKSNLIITAVLWGILIILSLAAVIFFMILIMGMQSPDPTGQGFWDNLSALGASWGPWFSVSFLIIYLLGYEFLYLGVKFIMTIIFCRDKKYSIKLKILNGMPICHCKEAFGFSQIILIYLLPVVFMYSYLFISCVQSEITPFIMMYFFFMLFFMSYDLTVLIYALFFKIKDRIDYISLNYHIYDITLYRKSYVRFKRKFKSSHLNDEKYLENGKFNWSR